jgi:type VI secretion system protein ImpG
VENEQLYKTYLNELQALERFRMSYVAEHPGAPLAPDDPDVRRLVEALAFFAARSRQASLRALMEQRRRLFRQFLPHLLDPLPAMGMLRAVPTGQLAEVVELPRGTEIALRDPGDRVAVFRTLRSLRLLPLTLGRLGTLVLPDGRLRLTLTAVTTHARSDEIGTLSFHVNYLNDFNASLKVLDALGRHVDRVSVSFDDTVDEHTRGAPCTLSFAALKKGDEPDRGGEADDNDDYGAHPLARERTYFHFPRAEQFFEVGVPTPPGSWQRFTLMFDLKPDWPRHLRLTAEVFQLFATPIVNLSRGPAQPILHDGTRERWPIFHPAPQGGYELHSLRGVYRCAGDAVVPLLPATIASGPGAYELEDDGRGESARKPALLVHLPTALQGPMTLSVDAEWLQPWFSSVIGQRLRIAPHRRAVPGVRWELSGELVPHRDTTLGGDGDDFTHILVLQHKSALDRHDVDALLQVLGSVWSGPFAPLRTLITGARTYEAPAGKPSGVAKVVHELTASEHDPGLRPLAEAFARHLERVLAAWIADADVEVRWGAGT